MAIAIWERWLAVPMPPPGPCDASAAPAGNTQAMIASDIEAFMRDDVMAISRNKNNRRRYGASLRRFCAGENYPEPAARASHSSPWRSHSRRIHVAYFKL